MGTLSPSVGPVLDANSRGNATFDTIYKFNCLDINWWLGNIGELDTFGTFNATLSWCHISLCAQEHSAVSVSSRQIDNMSGATVRFNTKETLLKKEVNGNSGNFGDATATAEGISRYFLIGPKSLFQYLTVHRIHNLLRRFLDAHEIRSFLRKPKSVQDKYPDFNRTNHISIHSSRRQQ